MRTRLAVGAVALAVISLVTVNPASAGNGVGPIAVALVTGTATCNIPTGHDTYQLDWTIENVYPTNGLIINSAVQSGAWEGPVVVAPNPILIGASGSASDGPVPGDTVGTVTLTVDWELDAAVAVVTGTVIGTIELDGDCTSDEPTTTTTQAAAAAVTRPAFTG
jgi:hypothetical protein